MGDKDMFGKTKKRNRNKDQRADPDNSRNDKNEPIPQSIEEVKARLNEAFSQCSDFLLREIICGEDGSVRMLVAYINGFVDKRVLNQDVIRPIL